MAAIVRRGPVGDNSEGNRESPLSQVRAGATQVQQAGYHTRKFKLSIIFQMDI
jgi:hypothetical protein